MRISFSVLKKATVIWLCLPLIIFLAAWIKPFLSVPIIGLICFALYKDIFSKPSDAPLLTLKKGTLVLLAAIVLIWGYCAGQAGFFYQSDDYHIRNALFRDLIFLPWPVIYPTAQSVLVYYIGHWLVPALGAKIVFAVTESVDTAWIAGNLFLWLWGAAGVFLTAIFLIDFCKANTGKKIAVLMAVFVFFSGMDIIGALLVKGSVAWHLEWWADFYQYSSLTTCMFWVFNQSIAAWLITVLILRDDNVGDFAFLGALCLLYAPFPFLGVLPFMAVGAVKTLTDEKSSFFYRLVPFFTCRNIVFAATVLPVLCCFYTMNTATDTPTAFPIFWRAAYDSLFLTAPSLIRLGLFLFLEFGAFALLLAPLYKKETFFLTAVIFLAILPFFQMGFTGDFVMRASIPSLFVLMTFTGKALISSALTKSARVGIIICLCLGAVTPAIEFARAVTFTARAESMTAATADHVKSLLPYVGVANLNNFVRLNAAETPFVRYLMR